MMNPFLDNTGGGVATSTTSGTVSTLARDARRAIVGKVSKMEAEELLRRIDELTAQWRSVPNAPLYTWLKNLRREVESA